MKTKILTLITFIITSLSFAQGGGFNYKALITDNGNVLATHSVTFKFTVLENGSTSVYQETQTATTDANGIVAVNIGEGIVVSGNFTTIDWGNSSYFLKVEIDTGSGYQDFGTTEFKAVPYAKYADRVEIADNIQGIPVSSTTPNNGQVLKYNGTQFVPADDDTSGGSGTDGVVNSAAFSGSSTKTLTLGRSNGLGNVTATFSDAVNDADHSTTNELQTISKTGNTVTLSNGGGSFTDAVNDADHDASNELQTITKTGNAISLSNGGGSVTDSDTHLSDTDISAMGYIKDANDADHSATNELQNLTLNGTQLSISNGNNVNFTGWDTDASDDFSGDYNDLSNKPTLFHINNISNPASNTTQDIQRTGKILIGNNSSVPGFFSAAYTSASGNNSPLRGFYTRFDGTSTGFRYGIDNNFYGSVSGEQYGVGNGLYGTGDGKLYGVKNKFRNSGNGNHYGLYSWFSGNGTGGRYGVYNMLLGSGTGSQEGVYTKISNSNDSYHYGIESWLSGSGAGTHYGTYNELSGTGTGEQIGVKNYITNSGDAIHYGIVSNLSGNGSGKHYGILSLLSGNGSGNHYGNYSSLDGTGTGDKYGTYNRIASVAGGTHYAVYGEALKTGSYAGYFMGNVAIGRTDSNKYILPATKGNADEIMQIDANGYVNWVAPSSIATPDFYKAGTTTPATSINDDIYTGGKVGIGTNSPTSLLHISAGNTGDAVLTLEADTDNAGGEDDQPRIEMSQDGGLINAMIGFDDASNHLQIRTTNNFEFYNGAAGSQQKVASLDTGGNLDITGKITTTTSGNADMKAYIYGEVTGGGTVITSASSGGFGVSHSTGVYTIIFSSPLSANNTYTVIASARESSQPIITTISDKTASSFKIYCWHGTSLQNNSFEFVVYKK